VLVSPGLRSAKPPILGAFLFPVFWRIFGNVIMAIISLSGIASNIRGSIGGNTYQRSGSGLTVRVKPKSAGLGSNSQFTTRQYNAQLNFAWLNLSDNQRLQWASYSNFTNGVGKTNKGRQSSNTGKTQFFAVNFWLLQYGKSILSVPAFGNPLAPSEPFPGQTISTNNLMITSGSLDIASQILVTRVSLPQSPATNTANTGMRTLVYTQANGTQQNWAGAYFNTFGRFLESGYKYWVETRVVNYLTGAISPVSRKLITYQELDTLLTITVDTTKSGSASDTMIFPMRNLGVYNGTIYWGDGSASLITAWNDPDLTHVYPLAGTYNVMFEGAFPSFFFNLGGDRNKVIDIVRWGNYVPTSLGMSFRGCVNIATLGSDYPDVSAVDNVTQFCTGSGNLSAPQLFNWDISAVTTATSFLTGWTIPTAHYDAVLIAWAALSVQPNVVISFGSSTYTIATSGAARAILTGAPNNWTITDGGGI